jgi:hypothetical protein
LVKAGTETAHDIMLLSSKYRKKPLFFLLGPMFLFSLASFEASPPSPTALLTGPNFWFVGEESRSANGEVNCVPQHESDVFVKDHSDQSCENVGSLISLCLRILTVWMQTQIRMSGWLLVWMDGWVDGKKERKINRQTDR